MANELQNLTVAILVDDGFEQVELVEPQRALEKAGAKTVIVSPAGSGTVTAWNESQWGGLFPIDVPLDHADPNQYQALLLPGGVMNPDRLRMNPRAINFVKAFFEHNKPVAAICHGPWTLVEADVVKGYTLTSWPSLQSDIRNAGGDWVNEDVVVDKNLVTSRMPSDIAGFNQAMIAMFAERLPVLPQ